MHCGTHVGISPIQIRLLGKIGVVVILAAACIPCPGTAAKVADPIVRRPPSGAASANIPVAFRIGARPPAGFEPRMFDRRVVWNKVEDDFELLLMRFLDEAIELSSEPKIGSIPQ